MLHLTPGGEAGTATINLCHLETFVFFLRDPRPLQACNNTNPFQNEWFQNDVLVPSFASDLIELVRNRYEIVEMMDLKQQI